MDKYEVMLYPKAFRDIDDIYAYIAFEKLSPENAKGQTDRIWDAIRTLELVLCQDLVQIKMRGSAS